MRIITGWPLAEARVQRGRYGPTWDVGLSDQCDPFFGALFVIAWAVMLVLADLSL
jgi:hypothetical protein